MRFGERFEIQSVAGEGGAGRVYLAIDSHSGERVALKVLRTEGGGAVDDGRFAREAALLAELSHPAIVRYVAHGRTPAGEAWLAMEWLEGESLRDRLTYEALSLAQAVALCERVAGALDAAHARGVLHRDVKPENLFLPGGDPARVKLLDFGIARLTRARQAHTRTGAVVGTPAYMAPEQARGERDVDVRVDVFSLGCVLFECVAGRPPFEGDHVLAVLARILLEPAPRLADVRDDVPRALDALCAAMLAKAPGERPADMRAVLAALAAMGPVDAAERARHRARRPSLTTGEQRLLSVVLASASDAPELSAATARTLATSAPTLAQDLAAAALAPLGASLEMLLDGTQVATLAGGDATDQAARAARCALWLRGERPDATITLAAGRGVLAHGLPLGEVIDRAVALLADERARTARGEPGGLVRLDAVAAALLEGRFDVVHDGACARLRGERAATAEGVQTLMGKETPFVGRDRELGTLEGTYAECVGDEVARAVLVTGAAGMGKSRVRHELLQRLARHASPPVVWLSRGDPLRAQSPYGMLASAVRAAAQVRDGVPLAEQRAAVVAWVARHVAPAHVARVGAFVGELAGVPGDGPRRDAVVLGDQIRAAWLDLLEATLRARPVLVVLEDLHWGDLPSVQLLDASLREHAERPFMVVALARPEIDEVFPALFAQRSVQRLALAPLAKRAAERMARAALGDDADGAAVERIVERAAGNALFIEELVRAGGAGDGELPPTVLALLQARLEALDPEARRVLRAASVFGRSFWRGGLDALLGGAAGGAQLDDWLPVLEQRELIAAREPARFAGEREYTFRHALLRDAAYATLTDADRGLGHRLAGPWLERAGELEAVPLAEHFERGGEPERAVEHWLRAAEHALAGDDLSRAIAWAERGVACGARGERLGALRQIQADAHRWRAEYPPAIARAREAMALLAPGTPGWYAAATSLAAAGGRLGKSDLVERLSAEVLALAPPDPITAEAAATWAHLSAHLIFTGHRAHVEALLARMESADGTPAARDPAVAARVHEARASRHYRSGDADAYAREMLALARDLERAGRLRDACREFGNVGDALIELGRFDEAEAVLNASLAGAERLGLEGLRHFQHLNLAQLCIHRGDYAGAEAHIAIGMTATETPRARAMGFLRRATIALRRHDARTAERHVTDALENTTITPLLRVHALALRATAHAELGAYAAAVADVDASQQVFREIGSVIEEHEAQVRRCWADALLAAGELDRGRATLREARDRLRERAAKIADPAARRTFLERDADKVRTLALVAQWLDDDDDASAA